MATLLAPIHTRLLKSRTLLAKSSIASSAWTGSTAESSALDTYAMPAATMGPNGIILITIGWTFTGTAGTKTAAVKLGGVNIMTFTATAAAVMSRQPFECLNRGSASSQVTMGPSSVIATTVDTAAAQNITFHATLANAGDSAVLQAWFIELLYGA
jgi:hypothetical protein